MANEAQRQFLLDARFAESMLRGDLDMLKTMCAGLPLNRAELEAKEGLGARYAKAQRKQLSLGRTAFDFSALPQLPHGKLPPFLTAKDSYRLLQNRARLAASQQQAAQQAIHTTV